MPTTVTIDLTGCECCNPPLDTSCCHPHDVPRTLTATISARTGDCTCIVDSATLGYTDEGSPDRSWYSSEFTGACGHSYLFRFFCVGPGCAWSLDDILISPSVPTITPVSCSCDPFEVVLDVTVPAGPPETCTGSFRVTITP